MPIPRWVLYLIAVIVGLAAFTAGGYDSRNEGERDAHHTSFFCQMTENPLLTIKNCG